MKRNSLLLILLTLICWGFAHSQDAERRYILHSGDVLELHYRLSPEYDQTVTLEPDGHATLYIAGDLKFSGLTIEQARTLILKSVSQKLHEPELNLILKDFQEPYVVVSGEVQTPKKIELRENLTALQALELAGGPKDTARTNRVVLFRHLNDVGRRQIIIRDLSKMKKTSDLNRDIPLEAGDMLFVTTSRTANLERLLRAANFGLFLNPASNF